MERECCYCRQPITQAPEPVVKSYRTGMQGHFDWLRMTSDDLAGYACQDCLQQYGPCRLTFNPEKQRTVDALNAAFLATVPLPALPVTDAVQARLQVFSWLAAYLVSDDDGHILICESRPLHALLTDFLLTETHLRYVLDRAERIIRLLQTN